MVRPVQREQESTTDHVSEIAVGLNPVPCLAQLPGYRPSAQPGARVDQGLDERCVPFCDRTTAVL